MCTGQLTAAEQAKTRRSTRAGPRASTDNADTQAVRSALTIVVWMDGNRTYATVGYLTWRLTGYTRSCCSATDRVGTSLDSMNKAVAVSTGALWRHTVGTVDGGVSVRMSAILPGLVRRSRSYQPTGGSLLGFARCKGCELTRDFGFGAWRRHCLIRW